MTAYDEAAQVARIEAVVKFLDLNTHQWDQWLSSLNPDSPPQIVRDFENEVVGIIHSLRHPESAEGRGQYLQAMATMTTSALNWFVTEVGKFSANWTVGDTE